MKRVISLLLAGVCCLSLLCCTTASAVSFSPPFELKSQAAVLYSLDTEMILYEKNADSTQMPAQLVQLMVAALCLEQCSDPVGTTVEAEDILFTEFRRYESPSDLRYAEISNGDVLSVQDLLYAMLLTSSCEASMMLADHFGGGSIAEFVGMMNQKAQALGMTGTVFTNPTGLYDEAQVTTARDMIQLAAYALKNSKLEEIATTRSYTPKHTLTNDDGKQVTWKHSNTMMDESDSYYYKGAKGLKTGNLQKYGRNLITEATRDGHTYLVLLMGAPIYDATNTPHYYHLEEATTMLDWAFNHFTYDVLIGENEEIDELMVENAKDIDYVILKPAEEVLMLWSDTQDKSAIQRIVTKRENVTAPVKKGDPMGTLELRLAGTSICKVDLVAGSDVERSFAKYNVSIIPGFLKSDWFHTAVRVALLLSALYFVACVIAAIRYRRLPPTKQHRR